MLQLPESAELSSKADSEETVVLTAHQNSLGGKATGWSPQPTMGHVLTE